MTTLERFARIRAAIEAGGDRSAVLRGEGIAPAEWVALQRRWLDALAVEIASGGDTLANQYRLALEAAQPGNAKAEEAPAEPPPAPAAVPEVAVNVPSYLQAPAPAAAIPLPAPAAEVVATPNPVRGRVDLGRTSMTVDAPSAPATPFRSGPSPLAAAAPEARAPRVRSGTALALDLTPPPSTPFKKTPDAAPQPAAPPPIVPSAPPQPVVRSSLGSTSMRAGKSGPTMPFQITEPEVMGFKLTRYAELIAARDEPGADAAQLLARFGVDAETLAKVDEGWRRKLAESKPLRSELGRLIAKATTAPRPAAPAQASPPAPAPAPPPS